MKDLSALLAQMTLEEKVGQLIQLSAEASSAVRPIQEICAFKKVFLKTGESTTVTFEIVEPMLRFWNAQNEYISEAGKFTLFVDYADHRFISDSFELKK